MSIESMEKQLMMATLRGQTTKAWMIRSAIRTERLKEAIRAEHDISEGKLVDHLKRKK